MGLGVQASLALLLKPSTETLFLFDHLVSDQRKMNRAKGITASLIIIRSRLLIRTSPTSPFQASQYHHFSPLLSSSPSLTTTPKTQQNLHFLSEPRSIANLIATNDWSEPLQKELLEKFHSTPLTHGTVVYLLKKLEKTPKKALVFFNWVFHKHGFKPNSIVYNFMLVVLCNEETLKEFWGLAEKMLEEGCDVDERANATVMRIFTDCKMSEEASSWKNYYAKMIEESAKDCTVKGVLDALLTVDRNDTMKLKGFKGNLSENLVIRLFHALRGDPLKALFLFRCLRDSAGYTHNAVTYNCILRIIWKKESVEEFWKIVEEMKSVDHDIDVDTYVVVSKNFQKKNMLEDFIKIYELMMEGPYKALEQDCGLILRDISRTPNPDTDLVSTVVKKHEAAGYPISKAVYDGIYRCLATAGKFDEAENILDTMRDAGVQPDDLTYYHGLFALGKAGKMEEGIEMLEKMNFLHVRKAWTNFIRGLCMAGEIDKALKCYTILLEKKLEVDADLLDVMVNGLCEQRRVDSAYSLVTELVSKTGFKPFHVTYTNLIQSLVGDKKLNEGISLLRLMKKHHFELVREPFVGYISEFGTVENAKDLLEVLSTNKYATLLAHCHVLQSFLREGRESEARALLEQCPQYIRSHADISKVFASLKPGSATA